MKNFKTRMVIAFLISFVYHFPYLIDAWTENVYLLKKNSPIIGSILDAYLSLHESVLGMVLYFPLYAMVSTTDNDWLVRVGVGISFVLLGLIVYYVLGLSLSLRGKRKRPKLPIGK